MKKVFLFGRLVRTAFLISFAFLAYAMIDMTIQSQFSVIYILLTLVVFIFILFGILWIYLLGIIINTKKNSVILILGLIDKNIHERMLNNIASLDVEKDSNLGMNFIINYRTGHSEKIHYKFYRVSIIEELQFNRIKKKLTKLTF